MDDAKRTCIVTGASSGIGKAIAEVLARRGERVFLLCRDAGRGEHARAALRRATRNPSIELILGDLGSIAGSKAAARALLEVCPRIDVLVHNAAVWPTRLVRNEDGLELSFVVNHLSPFILNHLLTRRLAESRPARVVQVSAGLYVKGRVDFSRTPAGGDFHPLRTYANTKLCNLLCTLELSRRLAGSGIAVNAVHPGVVRTRLGDMTGVAGALLRLVKLLWSSPAKGAEGPSHVATAPELAEVSGCYFDRTREAPLAEVARDIVLSQSLWQKSTELAELG
jgi:NAD(P)-dependent dehydrogenase (short-subunit alcohol dehydrogenase family)